MPDQYQRPYLDSSVFIGWLWDETRNGVNRKEVATHIFKLAERGVFRIYISAFTMAEVHKKWKLPTLTNEQDQKLLAFFEHEYIEVIDVDYEIGEQANRFCREYGLRPADAVHLACALRAGCDVLLAWDGDFDKVTVQTFGWRNHACSGNWTCPTRIAVADQFPTRCLTFWTDARLFGQVALLRQSRPWP